MAVKHKILKGEVFNRWTVLGENRVNGKLLYYVECTCGNTSNVESSHLISGKSKSCGCLQREVVGKSSFLHGMCRSTTYKSWEMMVQRGRTDSDNFEHYLKNGIMVCDEWKESFINFLEDMGERPEGTTLDRIDGTKGYYKENCRWANLTVQAINKGTRVDNSSGTKGVCWDFNKNRWRASLRLRGKTLLDKLFIDKEEAILARKEAEEIHFKHLLQN